MGEGASPTTVRLVHAVLHQALVQAVKWGLLGRNPADAVIKPKPWRVEMKVLNDDQVRALLSGVEGIRYEALIYLAVTTGLCMGELLGLKWSDLDWKTGRLRLQRQLRRFPEQGLMFSVLKTQAGRRVVALGAVAVGKLRKHNDLQHQQRMFVGDRWQENT